MKRLIALPLIILFSLSFSSFTPEPAPQEQPSLSSEELTIPSFKDDIWPLIKTKCSSKECHGERESVKLTDYATVKAKAVRIKKRVTNFSVPMPPLNSDLKMTKPEINLIKAWVDAGAPNN